MDDWPLTDLDRLAPDVDIGRARHGFAARRRRRRRRARAGVVVAVAAVAVVGTAGVRFALDDTDTIVTTDSIVTDSAVRAETTTPVESPGPSIAPTPAVELPWSVTIPLFAYPPPVEPLVMTIVDEAGRHCIDLRDPSGVVSGLCVDEPEMLAVGVSQPHADGTVYLQGLTSSETASYAIAENADSRVRIELRSVECWPERAFAAPLPFTPETIRLVDSTGNVVASEHL